MNRHTPIGPAFFKVILYAHTAVYKVFLKGAEHCDLRLARSGEETVDLVCVAVGVVIVGAKGASEEEMRPRGSCKDGWSGSRRRVGQLQSRNRVVVGVHQRIVEA